MTVIDNLQCVDCGVKLNSGSVVCTQCGRLYEIQDHIILAWPKNMSNLAREEAEHHDHDEGDAVEVHQLNRPRNFFYHEKLWNAMRTLPRGASILEIGAGSGFDAAELVADYRLTLTDVSPRTLARLAKKMNNPSITYIAADGSSLPFIDESFAGAYMSATLHHLSDVKKGINELQRILLRGGKLAIAVEPNANYFRWIKFFRKFLCTMIHTNPAEGSHADAEMEGFAYRDLIRLFPESLWKNVEIKPVWLLAGWWHYGAEFLFRALRLKKRIVLPSALEWTLVYADEFLFKIPVVKYFAWHWSISAEKI